MIRGMEIEDKYTKSEAKAMISAALGCTETDYQLAKALETSPQRLARYGDDDKLSDGLMWRMMCWLSETGE